MKTLPTGLAEHLATGATTMAWCWRLTRRDGTRYGFTDHDVDLTFDGTLFEAAAGFTASEIKESIGLGVDNLEVESALSSSRLTEADLSAGLYDDARVEIFRVNWAELADRVLVRSGSLGEVRRSGLSFTAEVRGLAHYLQQPNGRLYQYTCDAEFGDARCKVGLADPSFRATGSIAAIQGPSTVSVAGFGGYAEGWFTRGLLEVTGGLGSGYRVEIKQHGSSAGVAYLTTWQPVPEQLATGDAVRLTAGCDKYLTTCAARFQNAANFRGFPFMPGNEALTTSARAGETSPTGG